MSRRKHWFKASVFAFLGLTLWASVAMSGWTHQGWTHQGWTHQGFSIQGWTHQGWTHQGWTHQGWTHQGWTHQGWTHQGFTLQGFTKQGYALQGWTHQGFTDLGFTYQGLTHQGFNVTGPPLLGIDRLRGLAGPMDVQQVSYAFEQTAANLQVLQPTPSPPVISYTESQNPPAGIQLRLGPGSAETGPGSFIYVPDGNGGAKDLRGTFWNLGIADSTDQGAIGLYVSDWGKDTNANLSKYPSNDDIYLYTVYYRHPATQEWMSLCPVDTATGKPTAMAMPLDPNDWASDGSRGKFTFACTASGVASKCARNWGYKPWNVGTRAPVEKVWNPKTLKFEDTPIPLKPFYDACLISARADYCQDGTSYTQNGTLVDLFDTLDGFTSLNPTAGMAFTPGSPSPMMHEEFQISALDLSTATATTPKPFYVLEGLDSTELMSISPDDQLALAPVRRSGMQSSRYADLDPGRSCLAAPFIDRCDPKEPYACYRDANMSANPYGAFLAVNSARHCDHDENTPGAPLDPLCNLCVSRVCSVDPTCCADPGVTMYPGSLVWDSRCSAIRTQVCHSPSQAVWPLGKVAEPASSQVVSYRRGAVGAFEGIVTVGTTRFAEGWACDPDFPGASSNVQISVAGSTSGSGYLGATGATLTTVRADAPLKPEWRDNVGRACGEAGRHGFRYQLPSGTDGREVYVYGFDLDTQAAAPFSLLRGGKKVIPTTSPPTTTARSAIWSGWLEPTATGAHVFSVDATTSDKYRVWVNGYYVIGNWSDPDPTVAGAFVQPVTKPSLNLVKGVRYPVRIEYQASSKLTLKWDPPDTGVGVVVIPTTALYPTEPSEGNGLRGTYYPGTFAGLPNGTKTWDALDYVWTNTPCTPVPPATTCTGGPPAPGIDVTKSFAARFDGQVMAPVSGTYLFTADTDAAVSIWVDGQLVTDLSRRPPDLGNPGTCGERDICRTGSAISKTCDQGFFCSAKICLQDPACCAITWDAQCLQEVSTICHVDCRQTAPTAITLDAGVKYDIKVELQHTVDLPQPGDPAPQGAKLRLYWALDGSGRSKVPKEYLFGEQTAAAPGLGTGLNAAYFSDPTTAFKTEFLDRVDPKVDFAIGTLPTVGLVGDIVCGVTGVSACTDATTELPGSPALVQPSLGARVQGTSVAVKVIGAVPTGTVTLVDTLSVTNATTGVVTKTTTTYGPFAVAADGTSSPTLTLAKGDHSMTVAQTAPSKTIGNASAPVTFAVVDVIDTSLPAPPTVTTPAGGFVASNGTIAVSGTSAAPTVKVTVKRGTTTVSTTNLTPVSGAYSGNIVLPTPGLYTLTIENTIGGKTSSTTITARYPLPDLLGVTAPALTTPPAPEPIVDSGPVTVSGTAPAGLTGSQMIVGDGDGRYFREIVLTSAQFNVTTGVFTASLTLDPGRHVLKIFQRMNGLDGEAVIRPVRVRPAIGSLKIDLPAELTPFNFPEIPVSGSGAPTRTGLKYGVAIYQNTATPTKLAEVIAGDDGKFDTKVTLTGSGKQGIFIRLLANSLSGGGSAESLDGAAGVTTRNVVIKPPPPIVNLANPVTQATPLTVTLGGTGVPTAKIFAHIDGDIRPWPLPPATPPSIAVASNGNYSRTSFALPQGLHVLTVTQVIDGSESDPSRQILLQLGDITPPTLDVANPNVSVPATTDAGATAVNFLSLGGVTATDNGVAVTPVCVPANGTDFPIGTTQVTCSVKDAAGNGKMRTLLVTVNGTTKPALNGADVTVEAKGPNGSAVAYQVSATGFVADCGPQGSPEIVPCTAWSPVYTGLGFAPYSVAVDRQDGSLYATDYQAGSADPGKLYRSTDQGATWTALSVPISLQSRLTVVSGALTLGVASVLYIPTPTGLTALTLPPPAPTLGAPKPVMVLPGVVVRGVSVDPSNRSHLFAWNVADGTAPVALFETTDAGKTWTYAADGLPLESTDDLTEPHITDIAFDSFHPGRIYAQVAERVRRYWLGPERVYRRVGKGSWERLNVPPIQLAHNRGEEAALAVAPIRPLCGTTPCREYPTLYAAGLRSLDGGDTWVTVPNVDYGINAIAFDDGAAGRVYALDSDHFKISTNNGDTFSEPNTDLHMSVSALVQQPSSASTIYAALTVGGLRKTVSAGTSWSVVNAPGAAGTLRNVLDIEADPVDPRTAYLLAVSGFYKTMDGGLNWLQRTAGIEPGLQAAPYKTAITIDPFDNRMIYLSGNVPQGQGAFVSTDSAGEQNLPWASSPMTSLLAADLSARIFFSTNDTGLLGPEGLRIVMRRDTPSTGGMYGLQGIPGISSASSAASLHAHALQVFPDAARTVALSYYTSPIAGGTVLFSARDSQLSPASTSVRVALTGAPVKPIYDNSDGLDSLYVSGDAVGSTPDRLYKSSLDTINFQPVGAGGQLGIDFRRLAIDPNGGGQIMYAVGADDGLWISQNGGLTWAEDRTAPSFITNIWASPLDGAIFAAIKDTPSTELERQTQAYQPDLGYNGLTDQTLWKRSLPSAPPPGASFVQGPLRVTCKAVLAGVLRSVRSGSVFPIATTQVSCTATDVFKNTLSKTINIKVQDTLPPVITVPAPITVTTTSTDPNVTVNVPFTVTAVDIVNGSMSPACTTTPATTGNNFKLGITTVNCSATDAAGNKGTGAFTVTVLKQGTTIPAPILTVPGNLTVEATLIDTTSGKPAAKPDLSAVKATTSTGTPIASNCTPLLTANFLLGTTTVTCSPTDSGYTVTKSFTVTVTDKTAPAFGPTPNLSVPRQGTWGARVAFNITATDLGAAVPVSCVPAGTPAPGSIFATGTTVVTCKATDKVGNVGTARFNVVVTETDVNPPTLTMPSVVVAEATDQLGGRAVFNVSATDPESGARPVDCAPPSGSWFPLGESQVTCQTADAFGHIVRGAFPVRIVDTTGPQVIVPATIRAEANEAGGFKVPFTVSAFDLVDRAVTPTCTRPNGAGVGQSVASGDLFALGDTLVTCPATDSSGNAGSSSFHVIVSDTAGPVITVPTAAAMTFDADPNGTKLVDYSVTAADRGVPVPVSCTPASHTRFAFGTTLVTCVAYDGRGNVAQKTFNVLVRDRVAPAWTTFPAATVTAFATSTAGATVNYTVVATDVVDGVRPVSCTKASGTVFAPNKTTVTCTATDKSNNTATRSFTVWVQYQTTQTSGATFFEPPLRNGTTAFKWGREQEISLGMTGASAPITNVFVHAQVATVTGGVAGPFTDVVTITGTDGQMTYNSSTLRYTSVITLGNLTADAITRFSADLGDGVTRTVDFFVSSTSVLVTPTNVALGNVARGSSANAVLTIKNTDTVPNSAAMSLAGAVGATEWAITSNNCPGTLAVGASCTVNVRLTPTTTGAKQVTFTATNPGNGEVSTATIIGTGT